jgi:hypothetical protein
MGLRYARTLVGLIEDAAFRDIIGMARIGLTQTVPKLWRASRPGLTNLSVL